MSRPWASWARRPVSAGPSSSTRPDRWIPAPWWPPRSASVKWVTCWRAGGRLAPGPVRRFTSIPVADPGGPASPHGFPRVARLDADVALRQLADVAGVRLELEGPCPGGQVGAAYVRWPDGRRSVLTSGPPGSSSAARRTESLLAVGRAHGVPAPRYELVQELPDVPECLPGDDLEHFDFHPENVLVDPAGAVTGVVDWDGAGRSHGYFDLFTLRFDLARRAPELGRWLAAQL